MAFSFDMAPPLRGQTVSDPDNPELCAWIEVLIPDFGWMRVADGAPITQRFIRTAVGRSPGPGAVRPELMEDAAEFMNEYHDVLAKLADS